MNIKKTIGLILLVLAIFMVIQWFGGKEKPYFHQLKNMELKPLGDHYYAIKGQIGFYNPSFFSAKMGDLHLSITNNQLQIGNIDQALQTNIKSKESFYIPFEIRFQNGDTISNVKTIRFDGKVSSGGWFNEYEMRIDTSIVVLL